MKIGIVGQGLFGRIIGDHLKSQGHEVHWFDSAELHAGSPPAACLMKQGWLSKVPRLPEVFGLLDKLYGIQDLKFNINGILPMDFKWIDPRKILRPIGHITKVAEVSTRGVLTDKRGVELRFDKIVVAAGVWTKELCPWVPVEARWGMALLWPRHADSVMPNTITQWAPFKQLVGFQRGDGFWAGDGSALKSWPHEREQQVFERIYEHFELAGDPRKLIGQRPYVAQTTPGDPCWLEHIDNLIVATGGAKNGTAAAGYCALRIGESLTG
jgi:hypothetical protein